jgi:hypothetical protein
MIKCRLFLLLLQRQIEVRLHSLVVSHGAYLSDYDVAKYRGVHVENNRVGGFDPQSGAQQEESAEHNMVGK